jgi:polyisoprenoid-binding protein YceI
MFKTLFFAVLTGASIHAAAAEYTQVLPEKSSIGFVFKQMNVPVDGQFKRFKSQLAFDPAKPAAGRAEIEIDMAGVDAGSAEANEEVAGKLWFNTRQFPTARFVASAFKPLGGNRYEASGKLTIKGRTQDIIVPATLREEGKTAAIEGSFVIRRADFGIGEGIWADFGTVANEVQLKFRLVASAAK